MMEAALEGLTRADGTRPLLIAVTQLTSTSEERMQKDLLIDRPLDEVVMHYAKNAKDGGLDGVVCSPLEAGKVKAVCGDAFLTVTPGVRFADGEVGDQVRVTTPAKRQESLALITSWSADLSHRQLTPFRHITDVFANF